MYQSGEPAQRIPDWGVDARQQDRPGIPMETDPSPMPGVHWRELSRQPPDRRRLRRVGLDRLTPVYGTALPPKGLSGRIRRVAYSIPEARARHWMLLLLADRVDTVEYAMTHRQKWIPMAAAATGGAFIVRRLMKMRDGESRRSGGSRKHPIRISQTSRLQPFAESR